MIDEGSRIGSGDREYQTAAVPKKLTANPLTDLWRLRAPKKGVRRWSPTEEILKQAEAMYKKALALFTQIGAILDALDATHP